MDSSHHIADARPAKANPHFTYAPEYDYRTTGCHPIRILVSHSQRDGT